MRQRILPLFLIALCRLGLVCSDAATQPHIAHIVADDLGWRDAGFNGCPDVKTPNLDALAKEAKKRLFFMDQMKVIMKNMIGEPLMPGDDGFAEEDNRPPKMGSAQ